MVNNYSQFFSDQPLVKTFSEFQPLEEVIVGTPYHADTFDSSDKFSQEAKDLLKEYSVRIVNLSCWELFEEQTQSYKFIYNINFKLI